MTDHPHAYTREIPEAMQKMWLSQVSRLPEHKQNFVYGCLESSYRWGILHEYERGRDGRDSQDT